MLASSERRSPASWVTLRSDTISWIRLPEESVQLARVKECRGEVSLTIQSRLPARLIYLIPVLLLSDMLAGQDYVAETEAWRVDLEKKLTADDGWLTLTGLFFLNEGDNSFGSSPLNDIVVRTGPMHAGVLTLQDGAVMVRAPERGDSRGGWPRCRGGAALAPRRGRSPDDFPWPPVAVLSSKWRPTRN